jgi:integral membrane protein
MQKYFSSVMGQFRLAAIAEGISFLVLLFIAMPLKHFLKIPEAVKFAGWIHGLLFIGYCYLLIKVWITYNWKFAKTFMAFIYSLLPFGTFYLEAQLKKQYD